jgi:hypothetical protein
VFSIQEAPKFGAVMRQLAKKLGEDEEYYEILGLLHDIDWEKTKNNSKEHLQACIA